MYKDLVKQSSLKRLETDYRLKMKCLNEMKYLSVGLNFPAFAFPCIKTKQTFVVTLFQKRAC